MDSLSDRVRRFCSSRGLKLNTDLGQHFLIDQNILDQIIESADIKPTDQIVEIGAGIGVLTAELLKKTNKVTSIEIDEHMVSFLNDYLNEQRTTKNELTVLCDNALHVPFPKKTYKIVANIPYHITSPLLKHAFLESERAPKSMTLLIQREVAHKICDRKSAGMLTILVNLFGKPEIAANVPPECFLPPPKVESSVLHIDCFTKPLAGKETLDEIFRLTKIAFGQKRNMLSNTLGAFPAGRELLLSLGIDEKRRPQEISIREWIDIASRWRKVKADKNI